MVENVGGFISSGKDSSVQINPENPATVIKVGKSPELDHGLGLNYFYLSKVLNVAFPHNIPKPENISWTNEGKRQMIVEKVKLNSDTERLVELCNLPTTTNEESAERTRLLSKHQEWTQTEGVQQLIHTLQGLGVHFDDLRYLNFLRSEDDQVFYVDELTLFESDYEKFSDGLLSLVTHQEAETIQPLLNDLKDNLLPDNDW